MDGRYILQDLVLNSLADLAQLLLHPRFTSLFGIANQKHITPLLLDDCPNRFDRIILTTGRWQKQQFNALFIHQILQFLGVVSTMIIQDDHWSPHVLDLTDQSDECMNCFCIGSIEHIHIELIIRHHSNHRHILPALLCHLLLVRKLTILLAWPPDSCSLLPQMGCHLIEIVDLPSIPDSRMQSGEKTYSVVDHFSLGKRRIHWSQGTEISDPLIPINLEEGVITDLDAEQIEYFHTALL